MFSDFGLVVLVGGETVTTVGYGDIVPESTGGRLVGAALMLAGVALIPLVTSVAVSILTRSARRSSTTSRRRGWTASRSAWSGCRR